MNLMNETAPALSKVIQNLMDDAGGIFNRSANSMDQGSFNFLI
jgi:hypothetical protein